MENHNHCSKNSNLKHISRLEYVKEELIHHLPYAIFSLALGLIILSILEFIIAPYKVDNSIIIKKMIKKSFHTMFHSFHFLHILFATTGTIITFFRYSNNILRGLIIGTIVPTFFCILSDILVPYACGKLMGVNMHFHICFYSELKNVLPFLIVGIINGFALKNYHSSMLAIFSLGSHFIHVLISALASLFYMVSHGFNDWSFQMGYLFIVLLIAVVIPCTFSDIVIPLYFAASNEEQ